MFAGSFDGRMLSIEASGGESTYGVICDQKKESYHSPVCNILLWGTICNRKELGTRDASSNAHAVAMLYEKEGKQCLSKLDGSFVIIIKTKEEIIIARDHHGAGGQVYYTNLYFASSLALLQLTPGCPTEVNHQALSLFLSVGYIPTGTSSFKGIRKLDAGHALLYIKGGIETLNMFDTSATLPSTTDKGLDNYSAQYGALHQDAILRRIGKSRNVGILLSGGYDSGCNLAALRKVYDGEIRSYSIGFKGDNWSELPLAKCMSDTFNTIHHTYEIDGSEIDVLPDIVSELGDPFVEGGLMVNYAAMRMIGDKKPSVILGGDGSDQYFGTSGREVAMHYLATKSGAKPLLSLMHRILSSDRFEQNNKPYRIRFHLNKVLNILQGDLFGFESFQLSQLLADRSHLNTAHTTKTDTRSFEHLYTQHAYKSDIEKIINQVILFKASRMADMFGNTIAFPYMDLSLYRFLMELPVKYKCKGESAIKIAKGEATAKFLLKYHYKPMLPELITSKKKQGGFAPMPVFFSDKKRRDLLMDFILSSAVVGEFLNKEAVVGFLKKYDTEASVQGQWFWYKQNKAIQFFNLLNISVWWEQYVKNNRSISFKQV